MSHPSLYRAKAVSIGRGSIEAVVPQVFGETPITITDSMGTLPLGPTMGWVFFQAGDCEFPVWSSGGGADEVWISNDEPTAGDLELWFDPDAEAPGSDEIWIGPDNPDAYGPGFELWFDTDAVPVERTGTVIAWKDGSTAGIPLTTTPVTLYSFTALPLTAGRQYEVSFTARAFNVGANSLRIGGSSSPAVPKWTFDVWNLGNGSHASMQWTRLFSVPTTTNYTLTILASVNAGTGTIWNDGGSGIWIKDSGLLIAASP